MIIWDNKKKAHFIRINNAKKVSIENTKFQIIGSDDQIEAIVKQFIDTKISDEKYHSYLHLYTKKPLHYDIWLGFIDMKPPIDWWMDDEE